MERMDNLAEGRPSDDQVDSWYRVAWDQWQLMELKRNLSLEVRFLAPEEQEELFLQLLAARDSTGVLSPNADTSDSRKEKAPSILADAEAPEEDF
ncbi:hypothetical protein C0992_007179 [Termitomyces sp. T32_za158]|nr:hypothetical protein C0992_007179 [Termitomyces sp. T32_za158]